VTGDGPGTAGWVMVGVLSLLGLVCCAIPGALMIIGFLSDVMSR